MIFGGTTRTGRVGVFESGSCRPKSVLGQWLKKRTANRQQESLTAATDSADECSALDKTVCVCVCVCVWCMVCVRARQAFDLMTR